MAQDWEPHIWSCSANGNVYYSTPSSPDWQNICTGMLSISAGHSGVVCAIDNEGVINIRVGISDTKPYGVGWTSLLCEGKHIVIGSRKVVRITKESKIFAAILPDVISKSVYLSWYVVNIKDTISKSNLLSLDVNDNLYIASKSGDIFVYVENQLAMEQSFWKLIITGPKVPQGLISRLKSFASLGLLSDENDNVDVCSFLVGEKFMWLIRKNSKEIYQLEFDHSVEEPVNSWNRFRLDSKWTINCICGCKDSMIWAITNDSKLVTVTCTQKSVSVEECSIPSLTGEDYSKFCWTSVSIGYARQLTSRLLLKNKASPIGNTRVPPSTLSLYPSLSGHEGELISNGSMQHSGECCDDGSCSFCMDQKQKTLDDSLSPVQISLQKKGYLSSSYSPGSKFGIKRKADFSNGSDPICNERIILKAKRRKTKSQLPKLKSLEGIKMSLSQKLKKSNQYLMTYNPKTLQAAGYVAFKVNADEKLFDFNLEEECLSGVQPMLMSVPCSEDIEEFRLNSLIDNNNDTEAFEFSLPTSRSMPSLSQMHSIGMCTSTTPTNEILSSPVQETCLEEYFLQQPTESSVQPSSLPMVSSPSAPLTEVHNGAISSATPGPPPPPPPPPIPSSSVQPIESRNDICEEVGFKADSSSDEIMEEQFSLHQLEETQPAVLELMQ